MVCVRLPRPAQAPDLLRYATALAAVRMADPPLLATVDARAAQLLRDAGASGVGRNAAPLAEAATWLPELADVLCRWARLGTLRMVAATWLTGSLQLTCLGQSEPAANATLCSHPRSERRQLWHPCPQLLGVLLQPAPRSAQHGRLLLQRLLSAAVLPAGPEPDYSAGNAAPPTSPPCLSASQLCRLAGALGCAGALAQPPAAHALGSALAALLGHPFSPPAATASAPVAEPDSAAASPHTPSRATTAPSASLDAGVWAMPHTTRDPAGAQALAELLVDGEALRLLFAANVAAEDAGTGHLLTGGLPHEAREQLLSAAAASWHAAGLGTAAPCVPNGGGGDGNDGSGGSQVWRLCCLRGL
jgi:hypothetical protein